MNIWDNIKKDFASGDPVIVDWALMKPDYLPFLLSVLYLLFVKLLGPNMMKGRKPFKLRIPMIVYNFALVFAYAACVTRVLYLCFTTNVYKYWCISGSARQSPQIYEVVVISWIIYLLKYVEYLDTIFFVLRKKYHQITTLHVFHHSLIPICCWMVFRTEKSLFQVTPGIINGVVHVIMYTYYGLAAAGVKQEYLWWKKYLTRLQMAQFIVVIILQIYATHMGCYSSFISFYMVTFLCMSFFILFGNFYIQTYNLSCKNGPRRSIFHID
ncbi:elongation of very long chain fatty acids protein 7-like [Uloborus diversus]|uniref:elongation of very long chain fatty acids protein 7-like n=1 Tax=Uloborus diversus TaxID=327109 RepID=UPI00240A20D8|nr:elongation of very long chain fatty acids protein 7-like [Uloborus diversus]